MTVEKAAAQAASLPLLTNIAQIKSLSAREAGEARRVRVQAVVTFHNAGGNCFIQDETDALYLVRRDTRQPLKPGDRIRVEGVSAPGDYAPVLVEERLEVIDSGERLTPEKVTWLQLAAGQRDSKWVEIEGVVRWVVDSRPSHLMLLLALPDGKVRVYIYDWAEPNAQGLVGATLRVRAAVGASFNRKRQFVAPFLYANAPQGIDVVKAGSADASDLPLTSASALLLYGAPGQFGQRVRVRGIVTHQAPGQFLFIRDGEQGLQLLTLATHPVSPGTLVEARGFPVMGAYSPVLEDADFQEIDQALPPTPVPASIREVLIGKGDSDLISLEAEIIDSVQREDERFIVLQESNVLFSAHLPVRASLAFDAEFPRHSRVRLSGVCLVQETIEQAAKLVPVSFRLLLRSPGDILMVRRPPWWTPGRLLGALGVLTLSALASMVWIWVLRRRVRAQTDFISEKLRTEAALEERTRLARELHDSIEQNLAGIAMQLDTAAAKLQVAPQTATRLLDLSRQLLRRTQEELHSSVWNLRSHLFRLGGMENALRFVTQPLAQAGITAEIQAKLPADSASLPAVTENHLVRIAQEAVNNVLKHSGAKTVFIEFSLDSERILLRITDDGIGFDPATTASSSSGHFGFLGMRERAEKLGGHLAITSAPGKGTCVLVQAPIAATPFLK